MPVRTDSQPVASVPLTKRTASPAVLINSQSITIVFTPEITGSPSLRIGDESVPTGAPSLKTDSQSHKTGDEPRRTPYESVRRGYQALTAAALRLGFLKNSPISPETTLRPGTLSLFFLTAAYTSSAAIIASELTAVRVF